MRKLLLPLVVVVASAGVTAGSASGQGEFVSDSASRTIRLKDNFFSPRSKTVRRNTTVTFRWAGKRAHNVTVTKGPRKFSSPTKTRGTYRRKMTRRGRYTLVCTVHDGMTLRLRVR